MFMSANIRNQSKKNYQELLSICYKPNKPIIVVFNVLLPTHWFSIKNIYFSLNEDRHFKPFLFCSPFFYSKSTAQNSLEPYLQVCDFALKNNIDFIAAFDPDKNKWDSLEALKPDFTFYAHILPRLSYPCYSPSVVKKFSKLVFVPYGIFLINDDYYHYEHEIYNCFEHIVADHPSRVEKYPTAYRSKILPVGLPIFKDIIKLLPKAEKKDDLAAIKTILWTPHWFSTKEINTPFFMKCLKYFLDLAKEKKAKVIVRFHPLFWMRLPEPIGSRQLLLKNLPAHFEVDNNIDYTESFKRSDFLVSDSIFLLSRIYCHREAHCLHAQ